MIGSDCLKKRDILSEASGIRLPGASTFPGADDYLTAWRESQEGIAKNSPPKGGESFPNDSVSQWFQKETVLSDSGRFLAVFRKELLREGLRRWLGRLCCLQFLVVFREEILIRKDCPAVLYGDVRVRLHLLLGFGDLGRNGFA